jgi:predicted N-acetyltransferase YhbS
MTVIHIREAEPRDDNAVGELLVRAFLENYARSMPEVVITEQRKADLRAVAAKRAVAQVWVAEQGAEIVGTVAVWGVGVKGSEAWLPNAADLRHLGVASKAQGTGVSGQLIETAEQWARSQGATAMCLHVRRGAKGVRAVYEKRGYLADPKGNLDKLPEVYLEALSKVL